MRILAVRLDSAGDVLVTGPAIRALARSGEVTLLCGPDGAAAASLLPGVRHALCWRCPWIDPHPGPVQPGAVGELVETLRAGGYDAGVVFTSYHQSPLPTALLLRLAGVLRLAAISEDYPGSLLDVRHKVDDDIHEVERGLSLATAAGFRLAADDDGRLRVAAPLPDVSRWGCTDRYVVVHPGSAAPARTASPDRMRDIVRALTASGHQVLVTGGPSERPLTSYVAGDDARDLGGSLGFDELAAVLAAADVTVVGNTGPAHLSAAVGTPVVSLFAPTVPAERWRPYGVPNVVLGDQSAPCRGSRARECPVPGHPCLDGVRPADVVSAVDALVGVAA